MELSIGCEFGVCGDCFCLPSTEQLISETPFSVVIPSSLTVPCSHFLSWASPISLRVSPALIELVLGL